MRRLLCALLALSGAVAAEADYLCPLMPSPPSIDGRIDGGEWAAALQIDGFAHEGLLQRRKARAYVGATPTTLYFAIRSELPAQGSIVADTKRDSENLVFDDSVELWLDPDPLSTRGARYQMLANSLGHRWFRKHPYGGEPDAPGWRPEWLVRHGMHGGYWHCEMAVPIASIAVDRVADQGVWGLNLCRNWKQEWAWSSLGGAEYKPTALVRFAAGAAPVHLDLRSDVVTGDLDIAMTVTNTSSRPMKCVPLLRLERDMLPEARVGGPTEIAPGSRHSVDLRLSDAASRRFTLHASLKDDDVPAFERTIAWAADRTPWRWTARPKDVAPVDVQFAYYPSLNRMRLLVDTTHLPAGSRLERLSVTVRRTTGAIVKQVDVAGSASTRHVAAFSLPPLNGAHELGVRAYGKGVPSTEVVRSFERTTFPWERKGLGTSRKVYPPFTPIRTRGRRLDVVLRRMTMSDSGLWSQVSALQRNLLASPIRWEFRAAGRVLPLRTQRLQFVERADDRVVAHASFRAGSVGAAVKTTTEYDGMMRVDLTLKPIGTHASNTNLDLVIPLKAAEATHFHAMGDGIRNTHYAKVPDGPGTAWTSKQVACNDLPPSFCSYLYVGTPLRGLSWFAENDRGWLWDRSTPNVEVVRRPGVVEIRVHLVNRPSALRGARTITFGLLAAPVKPRIGAQWRHAYRRQNWSLLGTDINWLALGDCGSVYPAGKDLELWRMLARGNRERLGEADVEAVVERGRRHFAPYGQERVNTFIAHARHNLTGRYGTRMIYYYNRASYQAAAEFETFKDEWGLSDYRNTDKGNGIGEIKIVPSPSYIDHALYWYGKSFDIGANHGVYWDNWFFVGSYNTAMTAAYRDSDGTTIPSNGLWGLRELCKRTFQYMNERKMPPITMPHMTSTAILPLLSFATVQYDWEWKYSEGDVQDRFTRDYILLVSNGELSGTWPVLLNDHGHQADDPWTARTFAAVALLHELDCPYPAWSKAGQAQLALLRPIDDILKKPSVRAYRYWDDVPPPIRSLDADMPTIVYSVRGSETVAAVVSYAPDDRDVVLQIDWPALGLTHAATVTDAETGAPLPLADGTLRMRVKKHDARILRIRSS